MTEQTVRMSVILDAMLKLDNFTISSDVEYDNNIPTLKCMIIFEWKPRSNENAGATYVSLPSYL